MKISNFTQRTSYNYIQIFLKLDYEMWRKQNELKDFMMIINCKIQCLFRKFYPYYRPHKLFDKIVTQFGVFS